jgi:hypothetical protein
MASYRRSQYFNIKLPDFYCKTSIKKEATVIERGSEVELQLAGRIALTSTTMYKSGK